MHKKSIIGAVGVVSLLLGSAASASGFSFTGVFAADDDVQLFNFSITAMTTVTLRTYGYGGGTQADGNVVPAGGFDPLLVLYDGAGVFIAGDNNGAASPSTVDPVTDVAYDALIEIGLDPGDYIAAMVQVPNFQLGSLSQGFFYTSDPVFTRSLDGNGSCSNGQFCSDNADGQPVNRSNAWALDILNVTNASVVPVPAAVWLFGSGLLGLIALSRRNKA